MNSIYLFIRHTPSNEYYVPGSQQYAIKVKDKNKADSKKGMEVHSVSVLYIRKKVRITQQLSVYGFMWHT